jgi:hypothetical protein
MNAPEIQYTGEWQTSTLPAEVTGADNDTTLAWSNIDSARVDLVFHGERVAVSYSLGPDHGIWAVVIDNQPVRDPETDEPVLIDAYNPTVRHGESTVFSADQPGEHTLSLVNTVERNPDSQGNVITLSAIKVLPRARQSNLGLIIAVILGLELFGLVLAFLIGPRVFSGIAGKFDTRRSILLALSVYAVVAVWAFFLDSTIEYWFLAWMVAVVQGGSQALSRSLYSALSPAAKSGEFFGFFGVMEKFSALFGPLVFAAAGVLFGSSRPAILSLILFFFLGGFLLTRVNVEEGKRLAQAEDAQLLGE